MEKMVCVWGVGCHGCGLGCGLGFVGGVDVRVCVIDSLSDE